MGFFDKFKKQQAQTDGKASIAKKVTKVSEETKVTQVQDEVKAAKPKKAKKAAKDEKKVEKKAVTTASKLATTTILGPVVTEKSAQLADRGVMVFSVRPDANRIAVRQAFKELYKVTPTKVNIIRRDGKRVRFGRKQGRRVDEKKAYITLPKGMRIDIFEGV